MKLSRMANCIQPSLVRSLFDKAKKYDDVVDFTLGDPDCATPENICEAACQAIKNGKTHYSANAGIIELRKEIARQIQEETGVMYAADSEIIVTVGAMEALYLALCCLIDTDDEVIIPAPYWINYDQMVKMCGGKSVIVEAKESNEFVVTADDVEKAITSKTTAMIINSPNNPTGAIYDEQTVKELCKLAEKYDLMVLWDECYKNITYNEQDFYSLLNVEGIKERAVVINSCSKKFAMTGWRLGYASAPKELVACMTKLQENVAACANVPTQYAAIEAFSGRADEAAEAMRKEFEHRRNVMVEGINSIDKLHCNCPKGTFYVFVNIAETGMGSIEFANKLLDEVHVAVVPGVTYGENYDSFVRIAFTMKEERIKEGLERIRSFVANL